MTEHIGNERIPVRHYHTDAETEDLRSTLQQETIALRRLDRRRRLYVGLLTDRVKKHKLALATAAEALEMGYRDVEEVCRVMADYETYQVHYVSTITGEVVHTRPMRPTERQQILPFAISQGG